MDDENLINPQQLPDSSFIYDTPLEDIASADAYYDNQTVQVTGEVVGDAIDAGDGSSWIMLDSTTAPGTAAVSVLVDDEDVQLIDEFGEYGTTGTVLQVRGTYHLTCAEHPGISDLHAETVSVVSRGVEHPDEFNPMALLPGAVLIVIGLVLLIVFRFVLEGGR